MFGITKQDLLDYTRAGSHGHLPNQCGWFKGRKGKGGRTISEEQDPEDRLQADKLEAGSSTEVTFGLAIQGLDGVRAEWSPWIRTWS